MSLFLYPNGIYSLPDGLWPRRCGDDKQEKAETSPSKPRDEIGISGGSSEIRGEPQWRRRGGPQSTAQPTNLTVEAIAPGRESGGWSFGVRALSALAQTNRCPMRDQIAFLMIGFVTITTGLIGFNVWVLVIGILGLAACSRCVPLALNGRYPALPLLAGALGLAAVVQSACVAFGLIAKRIFFSV